MRMFIATAEIEILLYESQSLKEKRQILKSLITRILNRFNVSIAEIDFLDAWQHAELGLACISNTSLHAQKQVDEILEYMEQDGRFEVTRIHRELL